MAYLEGKLNRSEPSLSQNAGTSAQWTSRGQTTHQATSGIDNNPVGEIVGLLALSSSEAPAYVGSSSGLALAANLGEMVQTSVWNQFISGMQQKSTAMPGIASKASAGTVEPPTDEMGAKIIDTYFKRLHSRYPFLDRQQVWRLHGERWRLAKTKWEDLSRSDRFACFKLNLVYAIGATMLQLSEKYAYTAPEVSISLCSMATRSQDDARDSTQPHCNMFLPCAKPAQSRTSKQWSSSWCITFAPLPATGCGT